MLRPFLLRAPLPDNASHYFLLSLGTGVHAGVAIRILLRRTSTPCAGVGFYPAHAALPPVPPPDTHRTLPCSP